MNRRKFLSYVGCGCCGFFLNSCSTAPITDRRQFKIIPEAKLNQKAAQIYTLKKAVNALDVLRKADVMSKGYKNPSTSHGDLLKEVIYKICY